MKKFLAILVVGLGLLFIFKYTFSIKTYLKCEPYEQNSKEILYFAFDKRYIWSNYDPVNSEFKDRSKAKYGERYVTAIWDNIKINREEGSIIITPSLASIFFDLFKSEETKDLVLNCKKLKKKSYQKRKLIKNSKKSLKWRQWKFVIAEKYCENCAK